MFHFEDEFNYKNLSNKFFLKYKKNKLNTSCRIFNFLKEKFLERQFFGSNGRHLRSKNIQSVNSNRLVTINEINSFELDSIMSNNQSLYSNQVK